MGGTLLWFGIYCAWALVFFTVIWPLAKGRIPTDERDEYRHSPEWYALRERVAASRGYRCAACGSIEKLNLHHWDTRSYGFDRPWQLVYLCERHHHSSHRFSAHWWADWPINHERWLPLATALVVGYGKLKRVGRTRPRRTSSPTAKIPVAARAGDWLLLADGRIVERGSTDWDQLS